mmetsp:Transcript_132897/g.243946  ORF Transcript_132897/g.243946 Transcript_132897/m.243946 type:complete len:214 (+) Transcript_132897:61-702(+)
MGKLTSLKAKNADASSARKGVKKSIGKVKKPDETMGVVETQASADGSAPTSKVVKVKVKQVPSGPNARKAAVRAAVAARSASLRDGSAVEAMPVAAGKAALLAARAGPKPKMTGARMLEEIEQARMHADLVAEAARRAAGRGAGRGGRGAGGSGAGRGGGAEAAAEVSRAGSARRRRKRSAGPSRHSQTVLAAYRAASEAPALPVLPVLPGSG